MSFLTEIEAEHRNKRRRVDTSGVLEWPYSPFTSTPPYSQPQPSQAYSESYKTSSLIDAQRLSPGYSFLSRRSSGMESMKYAPRDPTTNGFKLSPSTLASHLALLRSQSWFDPPVEEPPIQPDDAFVTQGLIQTTDKSRFYAFIKRNTAGDRHYCRIVHDVQQSGDSITCAYISASAKDCISHVCYYLNYKPYKCKGSGNHAACGKEYTVKERRNDHYAKVRKPPDPLVSCEKCGTLITERNLPRHQKSCRGQDAGSRSEGTKSRQ